MPRTQIVWVSTLAIFFLCLGIAGYAGKKGVLEQANSPDSNSQDSDADSAHRQAQVHVERGLGLLAQQQVASSIVDFGRAIEAIEPQLQRGSSADRAQLVARIYTHRGNAFLAALQFPAAIRDFEKSMEICELYEVPRKLIMLGGNYAGRGMARRELNRLEDAARDFSRGLEIYQEQAQARPLTDESRIAEARCFSGRALVAKDQGKLSDSLSDFHRAVEILTKLVEFDGRRDLVPELAICYRNRGMTHLAAKNFDDAIRDYTQAIDEFDRLVTFEGRSHMQSELAKSYMFRAYALSLQQQTPRAIVDYEKSIELGELLQQQSASSNNAIQLATSLSTIAWIYATHPDSTIRDGQRAKQYAIRAGELQQWKIFATVATLAAACAELGEFNDAIAWQEKAIALAPERFHSSLRERLQLYREDKPYRE
jgi:tetratricopeptide (TPR) repeat protein